LNTELLSQHAIFFLEIVNDVELLAVDPSGEDDKQVLKWWKDVEHGGGRL